MSPTGRGSQDIHRSLVQLAEEGRAFVLAMVLATDGSTPCRAGAKVILDEAGVLKGTIGGGFVEAEVQRQTAGILREGRPVVLDFGLEGLAVGGGVPICGGAMRVLIDPAAGLHGDAYAAAAAIREHRGRGVLLTTVRTLRGATPNEAMLAKKNDRCTVEVQCLEAAAISRSPEFPGIEAVRSVMEPEEPRWFALESDPHGRRVEVLIEPLLPRPVLLIAGGGHVGQAVAAQASLLGYELIVIDDRPEFTRPELFPAGTATRCGPVARELAALSPDGDTCVVIVTRGHQHDAEALAACIHAPAAYIGMIGSRRKVAMMREHFLESGQATAEELGRVFAPIGLDIGAVTVPEIAASIVAQLIAVRRRGTGFQPVNTP